MRFPFFVVAALVSTACAGATNVDDLFEPTPGDGSFGGSGGQTGGTRGSGGSTGGTGGSTGGSTGGTGGSTGGTGGSTGGTGGSTGGTGGSTGGTGGGTADSGPDVRRDAVADVVDAGRASIRCGSATCDPATSFCCLQNNNIRCVNTGGTCSVTADRLHCDDTADCATGSICCAVDGTLGTGADSTCMGSATCLTPRQMMCDSTRPGPCLGSVIVAAVCSPNGSGIFPDYSYCHVAP